MPEKWEVFIQRFKLENVKIKTYLKFQAFYCLYFLQ